MPGSKSNGSAEQRVTSVSRGSSIGHGSDLVDGVRGREHAEFEVGVTESEGLPGPTEVVPTPTFVGWSYFVGQSEGKAKVDSDWG